MFFFKISTADFISTLRELSGMSSTELDHFEHHLEEIKVKQIDFKALLLAVSYNHLTSTHDRVHNFFHKLDSQQKKISKRKLLSLLNDDTAVTVIICLMSHEIKKN